MSEDLPKNPEELLIGDEHTSLPDEAEAHRDETVAAEAAGQTAEGGASTQEPTHLASIEHGHGGIDEDEGIKSPEDKEQAPKKEYMIGYQASIEMSPEEGSGHITEGDLWHYIAQGGDKEPVIDYEGIRAWQMEVVFGDPYDTAEVFEFLNEGDREALATSFPNAAERLRLFSGENDEVREPEDDRLFDAAYEKLRSYSKEEIYPTMREKLQGDIKLIAGELSKRYSGPDEMPDDMRKRFRDLVAVVRQTPKAKISLGG